MELQRDPRRAIEVRTRVRDVPVCSSDNCLKAGAETDKSEKIKRIEDKLEALKARDYSARRSWTTAIMAVATSTSYAQMDEDAKIAARASNMYGTPEAASKHFAKKIQCPGHSPQRQNQELDELANSQAEGRGEAFSHYREGNERLTAAPKSCGSLTKINGRKEFKTRHAKTRCRRRLAAGRYGASSLQGVRRPR